MRRGRLDLLFEALFLLADKPYKISHLTRRLRTRSDILQSALHQLHHRGYLVEIRTRRERWIHLTDRGMDAVQQMRGWDVLMEYRRAMARRSTHHAGGDTV